MLDHVAQLSAIPGARVAFGGKALQGGKHRIPACYGAIEPTAVFVPLAEMLASDEVFELATTEVFGPVQVCGVPALQGMQLCARPARVACSVLWAYRCWSHTGG